MLLIAVNTAPLFFVYPFVALPAFHLLFGSNSEGGFEWVSSSFCCGLVFYPAILLLNHWQSFRSIKLHGWQGVAGPQWVTLLYLLILGSLFLFLPEASQG